MSFSDINYLTVVIAGILNMIIGFLWYGPLFSKPWMKLVGLTPEKISEQSDKMGMNYLTSFVLALVSAAVFQIIYMSFNPADVVESITLAFLVWFGFVFAVVINQSMFVKKPFKLILIDSGYNLVSLTVWSVLYLYIS
jgi:hypothetical protein